MNKQSGLKIDKDSEKYYKLDAMYYLCASVKRVKAKYSTDIN